MHRRELVEGREPRVDVDPIGVEHEVVDAGRGRVDPTRTFGVSGERVLGAARPGPRRSASAYANLPTFELLVRRAR